jgi:heme/copper-type cytochrome/quinol oxidase subunit 2
MQIVTRTLGVIAIAMIASVATLWASGGGALVGPHKGLAPMSVEVTYMDFVTVLLTVLTIVLAALAIGIGFVAFRTIKEIKEDAKKIATNTAIETMEKLTKDLPVQVETTVDTFVKKELPPAIKENVILTIEQFAKSGELGKLLERAYIQMSTLDPETAKEFADETEQAKQKEGENGKS